MVKPVRFAAWGGVSCEPAKVLRPQTPADAVCAQSYLPFGAGRSYGDTCLPAGGTLIDTSGLDQIIAFDSQAGILRAGSGITLRAIIDAILPHGWFLPVTPGTAQATLGGALANDVHGKNHHIAGSFGCFVRAFELLRSGAPPMICSRESNTDYFSATIGGMGLTGLVTWIEIDLKRVGSANITSRVRRFEDLDGYFALENGARDATYSVAWIDGLAPARSLGRGLLLEGEHSDDGDFSLKARRTIGIPFTPPVNLVWRTPLKLMNALYMRHRDGKTVVDAEQFFYPLDRIGCWSRLYGPRGFHQFQCVIPTPVAPAAVRNLLDLARVEAGGSNLVVLKKFGAMTSPGLLSFPMPGYTLTMDFADRGEESLALIAKLERIALEAGGRINPYKTRAMSADVFRASFPHWRNMLPLLDPRAESLFSRRVGLTVEERRSAQAAVGPSIAHTS